MNLILVIHSSKLESNVTVIACRFLVATLSLLLVLGLLVQPFAAMIWFAAPDVTRHDGSGTSGDPWSLAFALSSRSALSAGDTLFLAGGVYAYGVGRRLHCKLANGDPQRPVVIRSLPGAWATIDGGINDAPRAADELAQRAAAVVDESPALRIGCAHTVWQDLAVTNSDATPAAMRKNS